MRNTLTLLWSAVAIFSFPQLSEAQRSYTVVELGTLGAGPTHPDAINNRGEIVGTSGGSAFIWSNGAIRSLGITPYPAELSINDAGIVLGQSMAGDPPQIFIFDGSPHVLPISPFISSFRINNQNNFIAGTGAVFTWDGAKSRPLRSFGGPARDLNDSNTAVFIGSPDEEGRRSYVVNEAGTRAIGDDKTIVTRINNSDVAIGELVGAEGAVEGAFLLVNDTVKSLVPPATRPSGEFSVAMDINSAGDVVGMSRLGSSSRGAAAVIWREAQPSDLNALIPASLGWTLLEARAINDRGEIAGIGIFNGTQKGFVLRPVHDQPATPTPSPAATAQEESARSMKPGSLGLPFVRVSKRTAIVTMPELEGARRYIIGVKQAHTAELRFSSRANVKVLRRLGSGRVSFRYWVKTGDATIDRLRSKRVRAVIPKR